MADFSQYQGPSKEWAAFTQENPLAKGDLTLPPVKIRQATNALRLRISEGEIEAEDLRCKVTYRDHCVLTRDMQNINIRVYRPNSVSPQNTLPVCVYFHGGGHLLGNIETEDAACSRLASRAEVLVANVGYRHTPEFKHPTQVNDAWDSFLWLAHHAHAIGADPDQIVLAGISAGAGLVASIVARLQDQSSVCEDSNVARRLKIRGQLLFIPWLRHPDSADMKSKATPNSSYEQNQKAPVLPYALLRLFTDLLDAPDPNDPTLNVGSIDESKVKGMPKATFLIAGQDLLRDEGLSYSEKLSRNGVPTKVQVFPGLPHGFRRFTHLPSSKRWDDLLENGCRWSLSDDETSTFEVMET